MTAAPPAAGSGVVRKPTTVYDGYALDLDGTVYLDDSLLPHAGEAVRRLRELGARVVFATNKPLEDSAAYAAKLSELGIPAEPEDVVTALDSLMGYLAREHRGARVLTIAEPLVDAVCRRSGLRVVTDPQDTDVVLVSFDRGFTYAKLLAAYQAVRAGAVIVATNPDPYCPTADGGLPDCAAMLAALEACTGRTAEVVAGKPSRLMGEALLARLDVPAGRAAMVGDRLATDVVMGQRLGMAGVLALSGATSASDLSLSDVRPDFVISTLADLLPAPAEGPR
ncbi:MAG: HAD-IIA family hydrolase [Actinomycetales bacterium]